MEDDKFAFSKLINAPNRQLLLAVSILELIAIIVFSIIYKLDYFHKITLKRIN